MNVLLVAAKRSGYTGESISAPFQGLLSLAAVLRAGTFGETEGVHVSIVDEQVEVLSNRDQSRGAWLSRFLPDVVGVQVCTSSLKNGLGVLREAKALLPNVLTVMGGSGVASGVAGLLLSGIVDVAVHGEGEATFSELICAFAADGRRGFSGVRGITYLGDDGMPVNTGKREPIRRLDNLPFPARDLVDMQVYRRISRGRAGNLITSRGCSYACAYCYSKFQWGVGQRRFSVERTVQEIRLMLEEYGIDRIRIEDDDFIEDRGWVTEFCNLLLEEGLHTRIEWEAKARPDHMEDGLLHLMRRAGCFRLLMGVETLDPGLLTRLSRPLQVALLERAIDLLRSNGIGVQATVILGIPGETNQAMRHTLHWLDTRLNARHDITSPCFFVPFYPEIGDAMKRKLPFKVEVHDTDWYTGHFPVVSSDACSLEELQALNTDMQDDRRGKYDRIAHLAQQDEVFRRMGSIW
jgi:methyltransferase